MTSFYPPPAHKLPIFETNRRWVVLAVVAIGLYLTLAVATLRTHAPQDDEAAFANPSYNLLYKGFMGTTLYDDYGAVPVQSLKRHTYWSPPVFFLTNAAVFKVFGFGLTQIRTESIVLGGIALAAWYVLMRCGGNSPALSLFVTGFISLDYFFQLAAANGRMDMMCLAFGTAGLATYYALRAAHLNLAVFLGNTLVAAAGLTHAIGIMYFCGLLFIALTNDWRRLRLRHAAIALMPYVVGGLAWGLYIMKDPAGYRDQLHGQLIYTSLAAGLPPKFSPLLALKVELIRRYLEPFGLAPGVPLLSRAKAVVLIAYGAGVVGTLSCQRLRRDPLLRTLVVLAGIDFTVLAFATSKNFYYLPHVTTVLAALLGLFLLRLPAAGSRAQVLAATVLAGLAVLQSIGLLIRARENSFKNLYLPAVEAIRNHSDRGSVIFAPSYFWFHLQPDRTVIHDNTLGYSTGVRAALVVIDAPINSFLRQTWLTGTPESKHTEEVIMKSRRIFENSFCTIYRPFPDRDPLKTSTPGAAIQ